MRSTRPILGLSLLAALTPALLAAKCGPVEDTGEQDLGPIEDVLDEISMTIWPGVQGDEGRHVRRVNGFFEGEPTAYWFAGFASRVAADVFWFCRDGDTACPFDEDGKVAWDHLVGSPVFARMPGEVGYSPFWLAWVVYVPEDYVENDLKSVQGIQDATAAGTVRVEQVLHDYGDERGVDLAIMHCLMVLDGTELQHNGGDLITGGKKTLYLPPRKGWHKQYRVNFYDYTQSEGLFAPDPASESVPLMPSADIFVFFRDCAHGSTSAACETISADVGAVSERGVEVDLTDDGDREDNNNIISGFPHNPSPDPRDKPYSPLWRVNRVDIPVENDDLVTLIDSTVDQTQTMAKNIQDIRDLADAGLVAEPRPLMETQAVDAVPGNDGMLFFNCPSQVPE